MTAESKARTAGKEPRPGRKAFKGMAPKGYRIRMMEPGEAHALRLIEQLPVVPTHDRIPRSPPGRVGVVRSPAREAGGAL